MPGEPSPACLRVRPLGPGAWQVSGPGVARRFATLEGARRWASLHLSDCGGGHLAVLDDSGAELEDSEVCAGSLAAADRREVGRAVADPGHLT